MIIRTKLESINKIGELGLNKFPEQLFKSGEEDEIKEFLEKYPARYYAIRDKSRAGGVFKLSVEASDVLKEAQEYSLFTINVSSINYANNQLLVGEVEFFSNNEVYAVLSVDPKASVRDAIKNPDFNFKTDIFDKRLNQIPCFDMIYQYVVSHNLENVIVEFSLFDTCVGIKNENIIVYEVRTDY